MSHTISVTRTDEGDVLVNVRPNTVPISFPTTRLRFADSVDLADLRAPLFRAGFRIASSWRVVVTDRGLKLEASAEMLAHSEQMRAQVFSGAHS